MTNRQIGVDPAVGADHTISVTVDRNGIVTCRSPAIHEFYEPIAMGLRSVGLDAFVRCDLYGHWLIIKHKKAGFVLFFQVFVTDDPIQLKRVGKMTRRFNCPGLDDPQFFVKVKMMVEAE